MPNVRASSGMIGTMRLPTFLSRSRFRSRRVNAIVVDAAALPEPFANSAKADASGCSSGFADDAPRHESAERATALHHVLNLGRIRAGVVVGRIVGELVVRDRKLQAV